MIRSVAGLILAVCLIIAAVADARFLSGVSQVSVGSSPLANGTYKIVSAGLAADGSYGWAGQTPRVQAFTDNDGFGQQWVWNGTRWSNTATAGPGGAIPPSDSLLADAGNGTVTENATGDVWTAIPVAGNTYRLLSSTGLYLSIVSGALAMSSTQTVWTIVAPAVVSGSCQLGNHGNVRGRTRILNNTIVAEDGCILRAVASRIDAPCDNGQFGFYWGDINWWIDMRDNGHFNALRFATYLGQWGTSCRVADLALVESEIDQVISLASQVGMYVIIDEHSLDDPTDWSKNQTFWTAIAPRYANNTNVLYELKNEPTVDGSLASQETSVFNLVRNAAPNTTIITNSFENIVNINVNSILNAETINYANAAVGWHPYETNNTSNLISIAQAMGRPTLMTEYSNAGGASGNPPNNQFIDALDSAQISWFLWCAGYVDAATGVEHGNSFDCGGPFNIIWPKD